MADPTPCPLCHPINETVLWSTTHYRVIAVDEAGYPGFTRVVWDAHVAEMTDLDDNDRAELLDAVFTVEQVVRDLLQPDKVNVASLGNYVPHLHWHIIPRFTDDPTWPDAIWAPAVRAIAARDDLDIARYHGALVQALDNRNPTNDA